MTITEQIVAALETKFPGVEGAIIRRVADKLGKTVTSAEQVATTVEGVTFQSVLQSYGDSRANEAQATAVRNYEKTHGLKDGEKINKGGAAETNPETNPVGGAKTEDAPAWAQVLIADNKAMKERLAKMDSERTTATRKQQLAAVIDKLPENLRKGYSRISLDIQTDEEFAQLISDVTAEVDGIVNDTAAKGAVFGRPTAATGKSTQGAAKAASDEDIAAVVDRLGI